MGIRLVRKHAIATIFQGHCLQVRPQQRTIAALAIRPSIYLLILGMTGLIGVFGKPGFAQDQGAEAPTSSEVEQIDQIQPLETTPLPGARPILKQGSTGEFVLELQALLKLLGYYNGAVDGLYQVQTADAVMKFQQAADLTQDGVVGLETWNRLLPAAPSVNVEPEEEGETITTPPANPESVAAPTQDSENASSSEASEEEAGASAPDAPAQTEPETEGEAQSSPEPGSDVDLPVLRKGMRGPAVERLQERLQALNAYQGPIDGVFGPATEAAVQTTQRSNQLNPDGIVGPQTWKILLR